MPTVEFDREKTVEVDDPDLTLLEIAREAGIPHASACGGNGRCSTCRVMILEHPENFDPRNAVETRLARAKGFDDNIRLACQTTITGDVKLRRLVIDEEDLQLAQDGTPQTTGKDRQLAILFSDIRNFTPFAESHLPYDVIHILGRYFRKVGEPVIRHGGYIDKYMGDGIMAIFGLERASAAEACLDAVAAGLKAARALGQLVELAPRDVLVGQAHAVAGVRPAQRCHQRGRCNPCSAGKRFIFNTTFIGAYKNFVFAYVFYKVYINPFFCISLAISYIPSRFYHIYVFYIGGKFYKMR